MSLSLAHWGATGLISMTVQDKSESMKFTSEEKRLAHLPLYQLTYLSDLAFDTGVIVRQ